MNRNLGYITRHVNYFFGMKGHQHVLVFTTETITITDRTQLRLVDRPDFVGLVSKAPATQWGGIVPLSESSDGVHYVTDCMTIEEAAEAVRAEARAAQAEVERTANDPAYALEKLLKHHDWTSWASDDYRYWSAGERDWKRIQELRAQVAPEVYDALLAKYSPKQEAK